jgi:hypothetical protein
MSASDQIGALIAASVPFAGAWLIALGIGDVLLRKDDRRKRACYRTLIENPAPQGGRPIGDTFIGRVNGPPESIRDGAERVGLV